MRLNKYEFNEPISFDTKRVPLRFFTERLSIISSLCKKNLKAVGVGHSWELHPTLTPVPGSSN